MLFSSMEDAQTSANYLQLPTYWVLNEHKFNQRKKKLLSSRTEQAVNLQAEMATPIKTTEYQ